MKWQQKETRVEKYFKPYKKASDITHEERVEKHKAKLGISDENEMRKAFGLPQINEFGEDELPLE